MHQKCMYIMAPKFSLVVATQNNAYSFQGFSLQDIK